ncbi:MAG TPA: hypothetical protein VH330_11185 [Candidatus Udaeobacter sp.]
MKANCLKISAVVVVSLFVVGSALQGQMSGRDPVDSRTSHPVMTATAITQADAEKKYPAPKGGQYPRGNRNPHDPSGYVTSPYPPYQQYDCSKVAHGGLVVDVRAKHVFIYP